MKNQAIKKKSEKDFPKALVVYIPETLDLDKLVSETPPTEKIPAFNTDCIAYILHLITYLAARKKDFDYDANNGFVPINKQKLQSKIYHYKKYINYLLICGILEEHKQYITGQKSSGLKFTPAYRNCKIKRYGIKRKTLIKAILTSNNENKVSSNEKHPYLAKWWKTDLLSIDYASALKYLDDRLNIHLTHVYGKMEQHPFEKYNSAFMTIDKLHRREYLMKVDTTAGRFHTLLTQLDKELRQYITFNGKKMVSIDLVNSQPLLATALLDVDILINTPIILETIKRFNPRYHNSTTILVDSVGRRQKESDILEYIKITSEGRYYEYFAEILSKNGLIPANEGSRKFAKIATFAAFYATNRSIHVMEAMQHFKHVFPNVYRIFYKIKEGGKQTHKALSITMQAFEADLFLNKICGRLNETNPEIPMFTIHDSVITTVEYQPIVEFIVKDELFKAIGVTPELNIEYW